MAEDARQIRVEVERARAELGATVEELAYRLSAPRRARLRLAAMGDRVMSAVRPRSGHR